MLPQQEILKELSINLKAWKEQYGIKQIVLFGSYPGRKQTKQRV